jgi:hypothetical protein
MIEGFNIPIPQRLTLIRITASLSLIISIFLSLNLWCGERYFPLVSLYKLGNLLTPNDYLVTGIFLLLIAGSLFLNKHRLLLLMALITGAVLVSMDLSRLQPWFYIYFTILFVIVFYNGRIDDPNKYTSFFIVLQLAICAVYIFNGLNQLNNHFIQSDFLDLISPLKRILSVRHFSFITRIGKIVPYFIIFIGISLLIKPLRYLGITFAVIFHITLFFFLFPNKTNINYSLWFLNITLIPIVLLLFSGKTKQRYYSPVFLFQFPLFYLIIILFWIMPFFNHKKIWPDYLSANFKSGNQNSVVISFPEDVKEKLPIYIQHFCIKKNSVFVLDYVNWCKHELNSDCYSETITFNKIYDYMKRLSPLSVNDIQMKYTAKENLLFIP